MTDQPSSRLTVWLCGSEETELRVSYCYELRARLVQRGIDTQVVALDGGVAGLPATGDPDVTCTLVLAGRADPPGPSHDAASDSTMLRVCFHAESCDGGVQLLPGREPVAVAVDRTLAVLQRAGVLEAVAEDVRGDEELMVHRLYDLGYL
jgi:hypothetical protein